MAVSSTGHFLLAWAAQQWLDTCSGVILLDLCFDLIEFQDQILDLSEKMLVSHIYVRSGSFQHRPVLIFRYDIESYDVGLDVGLESHVNPAKGLEGCGLLEGFFGESESTVDRGRWVYADCNSLDVVDMRHWWSFASTCSSSPPSSSPSVHYPALPAIMCAIQASYYVTILPVDRWRRCRLDDHGRRSSHIQYRVLCVC